MKRSHARPIKLKDYAPPPFLVDTVHLSVELGEETTEVVSRLRLRPNPAVAAGQPLVLNGEDFELKDMRLDGQGLPPSAVKQTAEHLVIVRPPAHSFELTTTTVLDPRADTALQGLYLSNGVYCTQCEAQGFRRITYMLDRPDVLARYTVRLAGDQTRLPVLLANGNLIERGTLNGGRHYAVWNDPHPKPSYLFAMVAGDLGSIASEFTTMSGRTVDLRIYVEHGKEARAAWAMDCLKRAMAWDERRFAREYDLKQFNIVAVSDFNMGAMENKGLNIFNDRLVLACPDSATDAQFEAIESVVAHEYFHNWTGNRITCRDWFQLCLKEGLTVYRDQEFSSDERSRTVQRIADVRLLKTAQFPEDQGPLAHPVRPSSYIEINNFYTTTVYEKGAEVVRMLETILGAELFAAGLALYFERHDGHAATVEDFISCFADASGVDLSQFMRWYTVAGTPTLTCTTQYDAHARTLTIDVGQRLAGQTRAGKPFVIPLRVGLVGAAGRDLTLDIAGAPSGSPQTLLVTKARQRFVARNVDEQPAVSLLRGFSAPVNLEVDVSDDELAFLAGHDPDLFNRWQALQTLALRTKLQTYRALVGGQRPRSGAAFIAALRHAIAARDLEPAYVAELLRLPSLADLIREIATDVDPELAYRASAQLARQVGRDLSPELERLYGAMRVPGPYSPDAQGAGKRAVRNAALSLLWARCEPADQERLVMHYRKAKTMTDRAHALSLLANARGDARTMALEDFFSRWKHDTLVLDLWFAAQAQSVRPTALGEVKALLKHPLFKITTPNKVRALIGTFALGNPRQFHRLDGEGYAFLAEQVLAIDPINPQVASRLVTAFKTWRSLEPRRRALAHAMLQKIAGSPRLSRDVAEIAHKLAAD